VYVNTISYVPIWSVSTEPPLPTVLGSTPVTFVTPTPFTVILDKFISISNEILVPIEIVAVDGVDVGVEVGVSVGVLVGVGSSGVFVGVFVGVLV